MCIYIYVKFKFVMEKSTCIKPLFFTFVVHENYGHRSREYMVVGFTTTLSQLKLWFRILFTEVCIWYNNMGKNCQWHATSRWFSPETPFPPPRYNWNIVENGVNQFLILKPSLKSASFVWMNMGVTFPPLYPML